MGHGNMVCHYGLIYGERPWGSGMRSRVRRAVVRENELLGSGAVRHLQGREGMLGGARLWLT